MYLHLYRIRIAFYFVDIMNAMTAVEDYWPVMILLEFYLSHMMAYLDLK